MVDGPRIYEVLTRKKILAPGEMGVTSLKKHLTTLDLTGMGVGATLGVGVYVLAGQVSRNVAGPGVIFSFGIAAVVSVLAGLCYAEFGARVPKAGSAYIYSYVSIGEFMAFFTGWILVLTYCIGAASVVRGLSAYVDSLANNVISDWFLSTMPMNSPAFGEYIDLFAFAVIMLFTFALAFGAKESTMINNIFTVVNLGVVIFVIVAGLWWVNIDNWRIPEENVPEGYGVGGFAPYGVAGIIQGAAICFYGFVGFDVIATAGEEAKNAKKSIPISIIVSLTIIFLAYFGISSVLTMMLPYFEQNENSPLPFAFESVEWFVAAYIISFGAIFGLMASLMGAMFPLPRIIYAMAKDGLMYSILADVNERFQTPMWGTLISGTITAIIAAFFNLNQLVSMMSIGVLLAYSMVAISVLVCSYEVAPDYVADLSLDTNKQVVQRLFSIKQKQVEPDHISSGIATAMVSIHFITSILLGVVLFFLIDQITAGEWWAILLLVLASIAMVFPIAVLAFQPESKVELTFRVPWKPWLPGLSIFFNLYLMMELDLGTWIRFAIWLAVGAIIYVTYSIRNSKERHRHLQPTTVAVVPQATEDMKKVPMDDNRIENEHL